MPRTRVFNSDDGQALLIPAELAYTDTEVDLEISRLGDVITIFPARDSMSAVVAQLRRMPKSNQVERRQPIEFGTRRRR